ncbi:MAG TPA: LysM domain-containing protein, partial [Chroococcales cyanobacterium]
DQTTQANKALLNPNNPNAVDLPPATPNTPTAPNDTPPPSTNTPPPSCDTTTPQPTTPPPSDLLNSTTPPPSGTYKLKAGDSFWSVAQGLLNVPNDKAHANAIYKLTEQLIALNPGKDPRKFHIGDSINLPQPGQS